MPIDNKYFSLSALAMNAATYTGPVQFEFTNLFGEQYLHLQFRLAKSLDGVYCLLSKIRRIESRGKALMLWFGGNLIHTLVVNNLHYSCYLSYHFHSQNCFIIGAAFFKDRIFRLLTYFEQNLLDALRIVSDGSADTVYQISIYLTITDEVVLTSAIIAGTKITGLSTIFLPGVLSSWSCETRFLLLSWRYDAGVENWESGFHSLP